MKRIFKNMVPYWHMILAIVLLLVVQAYCELSMPQYTSDMIDVGIMNSGVEHILPEKMTAEEYEYAAMFMTEDEEEIWNSCYEKEDKSYLRQINEESRLNELDEELLVPIVLTYRMANMSETDFKDTVAEAMKANPQTAPMAEKLEDMTVDEIGSMMQTELKSFEAENEEGEMITYVDMRPLLQQMIASGQMTEGTTAAARESMETMIESAGSATLSSMGVAYAISCNEAAGVDVDNMQISYLWRMGGKMFLLAVLMLAAAVMTGYLASRVGAGVGRDLREKIFARVVSFSNAEMDQFSTASLITRSTNDIQQIQMVTAIMLRMILYAPIIGIGGIVKVFETGADMEWLIVLAVLVIMGFVLLLVSIAMPKFKIMQKLVDALNLVSREILTGLSVIRTFGREKTEEERFEQSDKESDQDTAVYEPCHDIYDAGHDDDHVWCDPADRLGIRAPD